MKVSVNWLKELIKLDRDIDEVISLLPLRTIGTKEVTPDFFELDMKGYNRPDLLSMRGIAQEISAITDSKIIFEDQTFTEYDLPKTPVKVEDENLASLQCVAKIENLKFGDSPKEWIKKLTDCGMRPVNNIADVTNLIMLEYGQPLHAFDAETVKDEMIHVRLAKNNEEITTLDGKIRKLTSEDIVLADTEKPLDVAGVMGGKETEVKESTTTILLSASLFNPSMVRKTSGKLGLSSEASKRFQHGLTKKRCLQALDAAIKIYQDLGGKLTAISIIGNLEDPEKIINLRKSQMDSLIGVEIKATDVENYLHKLNFQVKNITEGWEVIPPYYRLDIEIEADVIEEIARMYGYEKLPAKELAGKFSEKINQSFFELIYKLKELLANVGMREVQTYSFYSTEVIENLKLNSENLIQIANPMSSETQYMRNMIWPNLLEAVAKNLKSFDQVAIFEINKVYFLGEKPQEEYHLALALSNDNPENIKQLYGLFEKMNQEMNLNIKSKNQEMVEKEKDFFHPVRCWSLEKNGEKVGSIAEVHPRIVNKFGVEKRVAILEMKI